ncbi:SatD family protein [Microbacterium sp. CJ88]|uniref:SatD family protein n=1 Tax=Microbacterium sp. CJ88 TaxID=3445672 RepID=UPI003F65CDD2
MTAAVIVDIVGSRLLSDREAAQAALDAALARVAEEGPRPSVALRPTQGDELQGVFETFDDALAAILLLRLALPDEVDCRFGVGIGAVGEVPSVSGGISEGPGWWAAREAIDRVHRMQRRAVTAARTWAETAADAEVETIARVRTANAYLLARDQIVTAMAARVRRIVYARCLGRTQREIAEAEGITQSAVSQQLTTSGAAAIVAGYALLRDGG